MLVSARGPAHDRRLGRSVGQASQSVKLIVLIVLIEYPYRVVSNGGTKLHSTASYGTLPRFRAGAFLAAAAGAEAGWHSEVTWKLIRSKRF